MDAIKIDLFKVKAEDEPKSRAYLKGIDYSEDPFHIAMKLTLMVFFGASVDDNEFAVTMWSERVENFFNNFPNDENSSSSLKEIIENMDYVKDILLQSPERNFLLLNAAEAMKKDLIFILYAREAFSLDIDGLLYRSHIYDLQNIENWLKKGWFRKRPVLDGKTFIINHIKLQRIYSESKISIERMNTLMEDMYEYLRESSKKDYKVLEDVSLIANYIQGWVTGQTKQDPNLLQVLNEAMKELISRLNGLNPGNSNAGGANGGVLSIVLKNGNNSDGDSDDD